MYALRMKKCLSQSLRCLYYRPAMSAHAHVCLPLQPADPVGSLKKENLSASTAVCSVRAANKGLLRKSASETAHSLHRMRHLQCSLKQMEGQIALGFKSTWRLLLLLLLFCRAEVSIRCFGSNARCERREMRVRRKNSDYKGNPP